MTSYHGSELNLHLLYGYIMHKHRLLERLYRNAIIDTRCMIVDRAAKGQLPPELLLDIVEQTIPDKPIIDKIWQFQKFDIFDQGGQGISPNTKYVRSRMRTSLEQFTIPFGFSIMSYSDLFPAKKDSSTDVLDGNLVFVTSSHISIPKPAVDSLVRLPSQTGWSETIDDSNGDEKAKFVPFRPDPTTYQYLTRAKSGTLVQHLLRMTTTTGEDRNLTRWATKEGEVVQRRLRCERGFKDFLIGIPAFAELEAGHGPAFIILVKPT